VNYSIIAGTGITGADIAAKNRLDIDAVKSILRVAKLAGNFNPAFLLLPRSRYLQLNPLSFHANNRTRIATVLIQIP